MELYVPSSHAHTHAHVHAIVKGEPINYCMGRMAFSDVESLGHIISVKRNCNLICIAHSNYRYTRLSPDIYPDTYEEYISVYRIDDARDNTNILHLVFKVNMTPFHKKKGRDFGILSRTHVCTTPQANKYDLYVNLYGAYSAKYNVVCNDTPNAPHEDKYKITRENGIELFHTNGRNVIFDDVITIGSKVYITIFNDLNDYTNNIYDCETQLFELIHDTDSKYILQPVHIFNGEICFKRTNGHTLRIIYTCHTNIGTTNTIYDFDTLANKINLVSQHYLWFDNTYDPVDKSFDNICFADEYAGLFVFNKETNNLYYITRDNIMHLITILDAFVAYGSIKINMIITHDIIYINWDYGQYYFCKSNIIYYYFNRRTYTLTPISVYNLPSVCIINTRMLFIDNTRNMLIQLRRIPSTEQAAIYNMLDEYLPPELCDMVWAYYIHIPFTLALNHL